MCTSKLSSVLIKVKQIAGSMVICTSLYLPFEITVYIRIDCDLVKYCSPTRTAFYEGKNVLKKAAVLVVA